MIYDIFYVSKNLIPDQNFKTFQQRFPMSQKVENLDSFERLKKISLTKFFWVVWDDLVIDENFNFEYRVPKWDEQYIHVFKNGSFYDGVILFSKDHRVTKKEFDHRFFVNKKEVDILASQPIGFEKFNITTYDEYLEICKLSNTCMFWAVWDDVEVKGDFNFDYQVPFYEQHITHVFKNGNFYDGICLFSKTPVSKKEFNHRFFVEKKEIDLSISQPRLFDVVFISYNEPNADENYKILKSKVPFAKRVDKVKGIHQAHIEAAKISETEMFWVVDGDAVVVDDFDFRIDQIPRYDSIALKNLHSTVFIWQSKNPINELVYGYGGVKLLPRDLTLNMNLEKTDVTTSISENIKLMNSVSNITAFNYDEFSTWRSAFRECVKLSSRVIDRSYDQESDHRLAIWCKNGEDKPFGSFAIKGAIAGRRYGVLNIGNKEKLNKINDYEWLRERFEESISK